MATTIAFRTFVDVYDDTDNEYVIYIPSILWNNLKSQFPDSTSEVGSWKSRKEGVIKIRGFSGELYGKDWWEEIEDDLLVCYAGQGEMKIVHKDCEDVANDI